MSLTKKDRKLRPNLGKTFPTAHGEARKEAGFVDGISQALRRQYGGTPSSVKVVARLTGANERAVKNWFDAKNGPSGENLIILLRHSNEVLEIVLQLADHRELIIARKFSASRETLRQMIVMIDDLELASAERLVT